MAGLAALELRLEDREFRVTFQHEDTFYSFDLEEPSVKALEAWEVMVDSVKVGTD